MYSTSFEDTPHATKWSRRLRAFATILSISFLAASVVNPKYWEKMSELLDALIAQRKRQALDYKAYLAKLVGLTRQVSKPETQSKYPLAIDTPAASRTGR